MPTGHPALLAFQQRQGQTRGTHLVMVADIGSATGDGQIYGLFECHQPPETRPATKRTDKKKRRR